MDKSYPVLRCLYAGKLALSMSLFIVFAWRPPGERVPHRMPLDFMVAGKLLSFAIVHSFEHGMAGQGKRRASKRFHQVTPRGRGYTPGKTLS